MAAELIDASRSRWPARARWRASRGRGAANI